MWGNENSVIVMLAWSKNLQISILVGFKTAFRKI
jgi:hypothetical protein